MDNFDLKKFLVENILTTTSKIQEEVEFAALDDQEQLDDVPSVSLQIIDDHEEGDSPKLFLQLSAMYHSGANGKIQILKDNPELQQQVMEKMQEEVQKAFRNVIHTILGEPNGLAQ